MSTVGTGVNEKESEHGGKKGMKARERAKSRWLRDSAIIKYC